MAKKNAIKIISAKIINESGTSSGFEANQIRGGIECLIKKYI